MNYPTASHRDKGASLCIEEFQISCRCRSIWIYLRFKWLERPYGDRFWHSLRLCVGAEMWRLAYTPCYSSPKGPLRIAKPACRLLPLPTLGDPLQTQGRVAVPAGVIPKSDKLLLRRYILLCDRILEDHGKFDRGLRQVLPSSWLGSVTP